nr:immunoglobulin light chain junction region [Macaca mulatta]
CQQGNIYPYTF